MIYRRKINVLFVAFGIIGTVIKANAQDIRINEIMASNSQTLLDEDGDSPDWIELYNAGSADVNLEGYVLSDRLNPENPWIFPSFTMQPDQHLLIFASDKDRRESPLHWKTVIDLGDEWSYLVPQSEPDAAWRTTGFDDSLWEVGKTSIGYGDGDDSTVVQNALSVYMRKAFTVDQVGTISEMLLHMDYDDGFIAFINGVEIARSGLSGDIPAFDDRATSHEASIYSGGAPEAFSVLDPASLLVNGENVLAVQVHNTSPNSSDMTSIPILSLGGSENLGGEFSDFLMISQESFHTNFKISSDGDSVILRNPNMDIVDMIVTGPIRKDLAFGRYPDGAEELFYFEEPTPGEANESTPFGSISGEVEFSQPSGIYDGLIMVEMSTSGGGAIRYTTDGSIPTSESNLYSGPLSFSRNTSLRARAIEENSIGGRIKSASYLFGVSHDLPIVSLSVDPFEFFDPTHGMYVLGPNAEQSQPNFGANFWENWERQVHVELIEPDGALGFSVDAGAKIFGGWSRANAQKSLSIFFRKSYGDGPIDYEVFPGKDLTEYSSLVLRNSGNDWNNTMLRDGLLTSLFHESVDKQAFRPAVIYINGEYWGIQNIREKINEHFVANNHDISRSDVELLEIGGTPIFGNEEHYLNMIAFVEGNDLSNSENYETVSAMMDIDNFIYYMTGNIFINNQDWPGNNIKYWRENSEVGKWRWIAFDTDFGFGIWNSEDYFENTMAFALEEFGPSWPNPPWSTLLLRRLVENEDFRNRFITLFADQLNSTFSTAYVHGMIDEKAGAIETEIDNHMSRWGGDLGYWYNQIDSYYNYAENRPDRVRDHISSEFSLTGTFDLEISVSNENYGYVRVNTIVPDDLPWEGKYFDGIPVEIEAIPRPGYEFFGWQGINSGESIVTITRYDDLQVEALFAPRGSSPVNLVINEINYNSDQIEDWVEIYNAGLETVYLSGWALTDNDETHTYVFPESTSISAGDFVIVCRDMINFENHYSNVQNIVGDLDFGFSGNADCVRLFSAEGALADEVCYENGPPWPEISSGSGRTLSLKNPAFDNRVGENWYASSGEGNPGASNENEVANIHEDNELELKVHPNPFSESLEIRFRLDNPGMVKIDVLDMQGRIISELHSGHSEQLQNSLSWNAARIKKGIYLVRVRTEEGMAFDRVIYR